MAIVIEIGEATQFKPNNEQLKDIPKAKGLSHNLHVWQDQAHRGYYLSQMAALYP